MSSSTLCCLGLMFTTIGNFALHVHAMFALACLWLGVVICAIAVSVGVREFRGGR